jgi:hypothetical protein
MQRTDRLADVVDVERGALDVALPGIVGFPAFL